MTTSEHPAPILGRFFATEYLLTQTMYLVIRAQPDPEKTLTVLRENFEKALAKAVAQGGQHGPEAQRVAATLFDQVEVGLKPAPKSSSDPGPA